MTNDDHALARELAEEAGRGLLELRARGFSDEPDTLRKAGDRLSHEFCVAELARRRPGDAVLSEEGADDPARLTAERVWIVDPLDGTKEFGEPGRTDWAVHVALWERREADGAGDLTAGAVVSRTRAPRFVLDISELINAELLPWGSAGAKVAAVVYGEADAYIHGGGFYEWDTAAPVAVARAAGLHASRIDGSALAYNQADLLMPDILVCRPALAGSLLQAIREVTHAS
jgi:3'(2'), 5'-bisphosphate nucleotidase